MLYRYKTQPIRMLELVMRTSDTSRLPSIRFQKFDEFSAVHSSYYNHHNRKMKPLTATPQTRLNVPRFVYRIALRAASARKPERVAVNFCQQTDACASEGTHWIVTLRSQ